MGIRNVTLNRLLITSAGLFVDSDPSKQWKLQERLTRAKYWIKNGPPVPSALEWRAPEIKK